MKLFVMAALTVACVAQVPQGSMFKQSSPELQAYVLWPTVANATGYKIYEYGSVGLGCPTADSSYVYDTTVTGSAYLDDPNPQWYAIPATDLAAWQRRWWCYEVAAVVNGQEQPRTAPVQIAIGASGYITMEFQQSCANGGIIPFPYTFAQMDIHLYYRDPSGVDHEFGFATNSGADFAEVETKIPIIANDGTIVPLAAYTSYNGYWYSWKTPDMAQAKRDNFLPVYQPDAATYFQINIRRVQFGADCPIPWGRPGGDYYWTQNVIR